MIDKLKTKEFTLFAIKVIIIHSVTYFIFGLLMSNMFNYGELFQKDIIRDYMLPINSPNILLGPFLQPVRGLLFAFGIWPIRTLIFDKKFGWLILWNIIIIFGILSTPAAAPCSIEGLLYSKLPVWFHLIGLPEILLQTLLFSVILFFWVKRKPQEQPIAQQSKLKRQLTFLTMAVMIACFAYIGYAIGGITSANLAGYDINIKEASSSVNIKSQLMFVVAFVINVIAILLLSRLWLRNRINLYILFFIFWFIDTVVPLIYQLKFTHMMPLHLALILGFFPAVIIVLSFILNRKNMIEVIK